MARTGPVPSRQTSSSPPAPFSASSNQTKPNSAAPSAQQSSADPSGKKSWKDVLKAPAKPILNGQANGTDQPTADPVNAPVDPEAVMGKASADSQDPATHVVCSEGASQQSLEASAPQQQPQPLPEKAPPQQQGAQHPLPQQQTAPLMQQRHAHQPEQSPSRPVGGNEIAGKQQPSGPVLPAPPAGVPASAAGGFAPMATPEASSAMMNPQEQPAAPAVPQPQPQPQPQPKAMGGGAPMGIPGQGLMEGKAEGSPEELAEGVHALTLNAGAAEFSPVGPTPPPYPRPMMPGAPMPYEMMAYYTQMQNPPFYGAFAYPQMEGKGPMEMPMPEPMEPRMGGPMPGGMPPYYGYVYPYQPNAGMYGPGAGFMGGPAPPEFFQGMPGMMDGGMPVMGGGMNGGMPPNMAAKRDGGRGGDRRGHGGRGGGMRGDMRGHPHDMGSGQDGPDGMGPMGRRMAGPMGHMGDGRGMDVNRGMGGRGMMGQGDKFGGKGGHGRGGMQQQEDTDEMYSLNPVRVERGEDIRTTVMVKNIPNKYTQKNLLDLIDTNHQGLYDFFYLPIDFKNKCNLGYAFINFRDPRCISAFFRDFADKRWERFNSEKVCVVTYARIQGKTSLVNHFRSSRLMLKHEKYRPLIFSESGKVETIPASNNRPAGAGAPMGGGRPLPAPPGARGPMMAPHQGPHGRGMGMGGVGPVGAGGMRGGQVMQVAMPETMGMGMPGMGMAMGMAMGAPGGAPMPMPMPGALPSPSMLQAAPGSMSDEQPRPGEAGEAAEAAGSGAAAGEGQQQQGQQGQAVEGMGMGGQLPQMGMAQA